jgi:hypothetical protein
VFQVRAQIAVHERAGSATQGRRRDGPLDSRLQSHARHEHHRHQAADRGARPDALRLRHLRRLTTAQDAQTVRQGSLPGPDRKKFAPNGRVAPHVQDPERSSFIIPKLRDLGGMD